MSHSHTYSSLPKTEGVLIRWARYYDFVTNLLTFGRASRLRHMTIDLSLLKPGESMLDVGCGTGAVTVTGKQRAGSDGKAAGIDPSPEMIHAAQHKAKRKGLEIDFQVGVIEALPFPDNSIDVVTASLMVHHLPSDELQRKGFAEIYRVLKPGGRLLIADMIQMKTSVGLGALPALMLHHGNTSDGEAWIAMLKQAGFQNTILLDQHFSLIGFIRAIK